MDDVEVSSEWIYQHEMEKAQPVSVQPLRVVYFSKSPLAFKSGLLNLKINYRPAPIRRTGDLFGRGLIQTKTKI